MQGWVARVWSVGRECGCGALKPLGVLDTPPPLLFAQVGIVDDEGKAVIKAAHDCLMKVRATSTLLLPLTGLPRCKMVALSNLLQHHTSPLSTRPPQALATCKPGARYRDLGDVISKHAASCG